MPLRPLAREQGVWVPREVTQRTRHRFEPRHIAYSGTVFSVREIIDIFLSNGLAL